MSDGTSRITRWVWVPGLGVLLLFAGVLLHSAHGDVVGDAKKQVPKLIADGKADAALEAAVTALERAADDVDLLELASKAAEAAEKADDALWYARLAERTARLQGAAGARHRALSDRAVALGGGLPDPITSHGQALLDLARYCVKKKLYVNAVSLLSRLESTPAAVEARAEIEKIQKSRKALDALLASGIDIDFDRAPRRSAKWIAKNDAKHGAWKKAWKLKTDNYTIRTNMGYEMAAAMSGAMEQMNEFYRKTFGYKVGGGSMARCTIDVYKSREEFEQIEGEEDKTTRGYFVPGENRVASYDPRTDGETLADLWETLFHECTHQFLECICRNMIPDWLNEGTAVYFEGARLRPGGRVEVGIAGFRLESAKEKIEAGEPTLKQVVSWLEADSYPGEYYALGGTLVYFMKHYENETGERVYEPIYRKFLDAYRSGGKHDTFERFVQFFVTDAKQPGIDSYEQFESRWKKYTLDLYELYFGPAHRADRLIELARRGRDNDRPETAIENYRWALRKRTRDVTALRELADVYAKEGRKDSALWMLSRMAHTLRRPEGDGLGPQNLDGDPAEMLAACLKAANALDKKIGAHMEHAESGLSKAAVEAAEAHREKGYPRCAVDLLVAASRTLHGDTAVDALRDKIRAEDYVDVLRWRRPPVTEALDEWTSLGTWTANEDAETLSVESDEPAMLLIAEPVGPYFKFEITIEIGAHTDNPYWALAFGLDERDVWHFIGSDDDGYVDVASVDYDWKVLKDIGEMPAAERSPITLAVEAEGERVRFFVNGKQRATLEFPSPGVPGRVGLYVQEGQGTFSNIRIAR